jgi:hypothetical protein
MFCNVPAMFVMPEYATVEEAITLMQIGVVPPIIAIDGLPCSGKKHDGRPFERSH